MDITGKYYTEWGNPDPGAFAPFLVDPSSESLGLCVTWTNYRSQRSRRGNYGREGESNWYSRKLVEHMCSGVGKEKNWETLNCEGT